MKENGHQACHDGEHEEGDSPCPQAGRVALDLLQSLSGDHVGEVQHEAQCPPDVCVCCLPAEVDVAPGALIELEAIEQQCQDVNAHGAVGVQVLQILREALHQLCPVPPAEGQDCGVDFTQRLLAGQVQEVEGVVEPSKGLGDKATW